MTAEEILIQELGCDIAKNQTESFDYLTSHNWTPSILKAMKQYASQEREKAFDARINVGVRREKGTIDDRANFYYLNEYKTQNPLT